MKEYVEFYRNGKSVWHEYWSGAECEKIPKRGEVVESWMGISPRPHLVWTTLCKQPTKYVSSLYDAEWVIGDVLPTPDYGKEPLLWVEYDSPEGTFWLNYYTGEFWPHVTIPLEEDIVESWISAPVAPREFKCLWSRMFTITPHHVKGLFRG